MLDFRHSLRPAIFLPAECPCRDVFRDDVEKPKGTLEMQGTRIFTASPWEEKAGFARAVVVDDWVFVSGTTGADPETRQFPEDAESQCENCFRTIQLVLEEAGSSLEDIVKILIFVSGEEEFERIVHIIRKHTYSARPANTTVFAKMVKPHMHVEIDVTARKRVGS